MLLKTDEISISLMEDNLRDYELMTKWLTDEKVLQYYEGRDNPFPLERVIESYQSLVRGEDAVVSCLFSYQNQLIGYLQYCAVDELCESDIETYKLENTNQVYAIDLFIGETDHWNKGIGSKVISAAINYLFKELNAQRIVIDPETWNARAIRCYEKCGFVKVKLLPKHELHEGEYRDSWLMAIDRDKSVHL
jgi:aminoglycoside 6'-N-acetyltransferase